MQAMPNTILITGIVVLNEIELPQIGKSQIISPIPGEMTQWWIAKRQWIAKISLRRGLNRQPMMSAQTPKLPPVFFLLSSPHVSHPGTGQININAKDKHRCTREFWCLCFHNNHPASGIGTTTDSYQVAHIQRINSFIFRNNQRDVTPTSWRRWQDTSWHTRYRSIKLMNRPHAFKIQTDTSLELTHWLDDHFAK